MSNTHIMETQVPIESVKIISQQNQLQKLYSSIDFIMVLSGEIQLTINNRNVYLNKNDVIMVGSNEHPYINASGSNMLMIISVKKSFFAENGIDDNREIICNSAQDRERNYSELRRILSGIAIAHYEQSGVSAIRIKELCYSLIYYLSSYHRLHSGSYVSSDIEKDRTLIIIDYLEKNYMNPVSLSDISGLTHLNNSYICRFFKKATGKTFNEYLTDIRLNHARKDLLGSDKPVTSIAYENGFSTPAAFCRIFAEKYGLTPSKYRKGLDKNNREKNIVDEVMGNSSIAYKEIEEELKSLAEQSKDSELTNVHFPSIRNIVIDNVTLHKEINPCWNKLINLGYSKNLINSEFQRQLCMLQNEMPFHYGRIEGLLNDDVIPAIDDDHFNCTEADRIIGIMLSNNIKPYIDLSLRGSNVLLSGKEEVIYRNYDVNSFSGLFTKKLSFVIRHYINRYGIDEVNSWAFDIGIYHNEMLRLLETPNEYAKRAKRTFEIIRNLLPEALIGGITYNAGMRHGTFEAIVKEISAVGFRSDFISTCIFPYENIGVVDTDIRNVSADPDHVKNEIMTERTILEKYADVTQQIWIVAMGVSIQTEDYVNDTCFQATHFIKNTIDLAELVEVIGYYQLSDISAEYRIASRILYGASGIVSRDGLKKTGYFALKLLNQLCKKKIKSEECMLAATNGVNRYNVILCNYSYYSDDYCKKEGGSCLENAYDVFAELETKALAIRIKGMTPGRYKIASASISREHGSVFDEWIKYGILDDLQPVDIEYLNNVVHPQRMAHYVDCRDGEIMIETQLLPHESRFYEINRIV